MCKIAVKMIVTFNRKIRKKLCRFAARGDSRCLHYIPREREVPTHTAAPAHRGPVPLRGAIIHR